MKTETDMSKLSISLRQQAVKHGLCQLWRREWSDDCTPQDLIDKFKRGIDFCIEHDFPSLEVIHRHFNADLLHQNFIYTDETLRLDEAPSGIYVLQGACTGVLRFHSFATATLHLRHNTHVTVIAEDMARVFIRLHDDSDADIIDLSGSTVRTYDRR